MITHLICALRSSLIPAAAILRTWFDSTTLDKNVSNAGDFCSTSRHTPRSFSRRVTELAGADGGIYRSQNKSSA